MQASVSCYMSELVTVRWCDLVEDLSSTGYAVVHSRQQPEQSYEVLCGKPTISDPVGK